MSALDDWLSGADSAGWLNFPNNITWPIGAHTGDARIVVGADTPEVLQDQNIVAAILFYAVDNATQLEMGYFFIGVSNIYDIDDQKSLLYGSVMYPVPGDPESVTPADVYVHQQLNLGHPGDKYTVFKNVRVIFQSSCGNVQVDPTLYTGQTVHEGSTHFNDQAIHNASAFFQDGQVQFNSTDLVLMNSPQRYGPDADLTYSHGAWPIGRDRRYRAPVDQGTSQVTPIQEYSQYLFDTGLPAGSYEIEMMLHISGPAASGGAVTNLDTIWETTGTVVRRERTILGPPNTSTAATISFPGNIPGMQSLFSTIPHTQVTRNAVNTIPMTTYLRGWIQWSSDNNDFYLKFMRDSGAAPAGDVNLLAGSWMRIKRWE